MISSFPDLMFSVSLERHGHVRRYSICASKFGGWEVTLESDRQLARRANYHDWHRVERACEAFALEVSELTARGWQVVNEETPGQSFGT